VRVRGKVQGTGAVDRTRDTEKGLRTWLHRPTQRPNPKALPAAVRRRPSQRPEPPHL